MTGVAVGGSTVASTRVVAVGSTVGRGLVGTIVAGTIWGVEVGEGKGTSVAGVGPSLMGVGSGGWVGIGRSCDDSTSAAINVSATPPTATSPVKIDRQGEGPGF
jgi:hypothetical protein